MDNYQERQEMIAANSSNTGGTADLNSYGFETSVSARNECDVEFLHDFDLHERAVHINHCRMFLFSRLGAVLTLSGGSVRYWVLSRQPESGGQQRRPRRIGFFAGFCSRARGLHWNRKRD